LLAILLTKLEPSDVFTVSFFSSESGHLQGAQLTHENITAGVAAVRALFPLSHAFSQLDTIVSAHSMGTAYGRAIAYTAIYEGASFASLESSKLFHANECQSTIHATYESVLTHLFRHAPDQCGRCPLLQSLPHPSPDRRIPQNRACAHIGPCHLEGSAQVLALPLRLAPQARSSH
jgi:acyl-CoA synthetase (AMP-forming)/AMP-acid ligase II